MAPIWWPRFGDEIRRLQQAQMLRYCLACHGEMLAKFTQRLPVSLMQLIEQLAAARIGQCFENGIHDSNV